MDSAFEAAWRTARRLGVPEQAAEDIAQEAFIIVSRRLHEVKPGCERSFLLSATVRLAANYRRSARARLETSDSSLALPLCDDTPGAEELLGEKQKRYLLSLVLDAMPDRLREVFVLFELEGMTSQKIGEVLGIPAPTARSRLRRAREVFFTHAARIQRRGGVGT